MSRYDEVREVTLTRDCPAVMVPWGTPASLEEGMHAQITQRLGGTFTVVIEGNMYRIEGRDADALGLEVEQEPESDSIAPRTREQVEEAAWERLATCYDPEIPIDIVNLGLVYGCEAKELTDGRYHIAVQMTLTAPGCGMGTFIADEARDKLLTIPGVDTVDVDLVWDPPWDRHMMSEAARLEMGMF